MGSELESGLSAVAAFIRKLLKARFTGRDDRHFSHDKYTGENHQ